MRILAFATNPETGASTRFRVLQWVPHLQQAGFSVHLDAFCSNRAAAVLYQPGRHVSKMAYCVSGTVRRVKNLAQAPRIADLLFVHREAFPLGCSVLFRRLQRFPGPVIYDYDDAMFLPQRQGRGILARIENLETPRRLMERSDVVLAGNHYLADYAQRYARQVMVLPTCVDTQRFRPRDLRGAGDVDRRPVVGWIGSHSTAKYIESLRPTLEAVAERAPFRMYIVGSPGRVAFKGIEVEQAPWTLSREVEDFARCDIGVYPVWDDPWARGKCGFKAIQFMACGVPVVASAVGVNQEILKDGVNGYLARTPEQWVEKLHRLLTDAVLRRRLGEMGRRTIEEHYAVDVHAPRLVNVLNESLKHREQC